MQLAHTKSAAAEAATADTATNRTCGEAAPVIRLPRRQGLTTDTTAGRVLKVEMRAALRVSSLRYNRALWASRAVSLPIENTILSCIYKGLHSCGTSNAVEQNV